MAKVANIKNVSKGSFLLSLNQVTAGRSFKMKPNSLVGVDEDELNYLMNECQGAFTKGYLQVVDIDEDCKIDIVKTENVMSDEEIENLLNSPFAKIKSSINKIDETRLLKEIRQKAEALNKSNKTLEIIDERIKQVADSLVL